MKKLVDFDVRAMLRDRNMVNPVVGFGVGDSQSLVVGVLHQGFSLVKEVVEQLLLEALHRSSSLDSSVLALPADREGFPSLFRPTSGQRCR